MNNVTNPVITIDGASGTGKGTIGQLLAKTLKWNFLDSGALYRVLALAAYKHGVSFENEQTLSVLGEHFDVKFLTQDTFFSRIILEGEEVTDAIRTEKIGNAASIIAALPGVRKALLHRQRAFREPPGLVADGRDMGTVIFPDAELKIFLTASLKERVSRRHRQLKEQAIDVNLDDLIKELEERDKRDQGRVFAPLKPARDAIIINTDHLLIKQVVDLIFKEIERKKAFPAISNLFCEAMI